MPLVFPPAPNAYFNRAKEPTTKPVEPLQSSIPQPMLQPMPQQPQNPHRMAPLQHLLKQQQPTVAPQMIPQMKPPMIPPMPQQMFPPMPPPMLPPTPPQFAPQMQSPQNAAEQFRQMNQNLPDGVKYEPLDDEIMKILRGKTTPPAPTMVTPEVPSAATAQPLPPEAVEIIKGMANCEKSMYAFFKNFPDNPQMAALADASEKRSKTLSSLIESLN